MLFPLPTFELKSIKAPAVCSHCNTRWDAPTTGTLMNQCTCGGELRPHEKLVPVAALESLAADMMMVAGDATSDEAYRVGKRCADSLRALIHTAQRRNDVDALTPQELSIDEHRRQIGDPRL